MIMDLILAHSFLAVKFFVNFAEFFVGEVGVDLGGGDGAVPEHFLHGADVGAVNEQFGGVAVAQGMRCDLLGDSGFESGFADDGLNADGGEAMFFFVEEVFF